MAINNTQESIRNCKKVWTKLKKVRIEDVAKEKRVAGYSKKWEKLRRQQTIVKALKSVRL